MVAAALHILALAAMVGRLHDAAAAPARLEQRVECPAEIPQAALPLAKAPEGWTASTRGSLMLHAVDLSYGPPAEMAFLKPQIVTPGGKKYVYKWTELMATSANGGVWVACNYGRSDHTILGKRLDDRVKECTATDTLDKQGRLVIIIQCVMRPRSYAIFILPN